jgi:hypothetical protein
MQRRRNLGLLLILLGGLLVLGASLRAGAQDGSTDQADCVTSPELCLEADSYPLEDILEKQGESQFGAGATGELLAAGVIPAALPPAAAMALQRVRLAPGASIVTPADDPRIILLYVEQGTLTVQNTVATTVTRGSLLATPGAQAEETMPADTAFTMMAGDSSLSPAGSGGELRNDGSEEVVLLAALLVPIPDSTATPEAGTPIS